MSKNQKYFKKEDLDKLDKFIQESLDKYYSVQPWDELYQITGENHKYIISNNSTIPDLVIYNKGFNKLNCFYYPNVKGYKKKVKFPRKFFHIKQKENKNYNRIKSNNYGDIFDIKFCPHNNNILSSANQNYLLFWKIPDENFNNTIIEKSLICHEHNKEINYISFNPVIKDMLCTSDLNNEIFVWNDEKLESYNQFKIDEDENASMIEWNPKGDLIGVTTIKKYINIIDPREKNIILKKEISNGHFSPKFVWVDDNSFAVICSSSKNKPKKLILWDIRKIKENEIEKGEQESEIINDIKYVNSTPFINRDLNLIYVFKGLSSKIDIFNYSKGIFEREEYNINIVPSFSLLLNKNLLDPNKKEIDRFVICSQDEIYYESVFWSDEYNLENIDKNISSSNDDIINKMDNVNQFINKEDLGSENSENLNDEEDKDDNNNENIKENNNENINENNLEIKEKYIKENNNEIIDENIIENIYEINHENINKNKEKNNELKEEKLEEESQNNIICDSDEQNKLSNNQSEEENNENQNLQDEIEKNEEITNKILDENELLRNENEKLKKENENCYKNNNLSKKIKEQEEIISKKNEEINKYENKIVKLEKEKEIKEQEIKDKKNQIDEYKNKISNLENEIKKEKEMNSSKINDEIKLIKEKYEKVLQEEFKRIEKSLIEKMENKFNQYENDLKKDKIKFDKVNESIPSCKTIHYGIKCEKCFQEPIKGYRYKCSECGDYNLCDKCEEKNSLENEHPHNFIKIRKDLNNNHVNYSNYSYECVKITPEILEIYDDTEQANIEISLKNNGDEAWPENKTKLSFDNESDIIGEDVVLAPQIPGEEKSYLVKFSELGNKSIGDYISNLGFFINDKQIGENLTLKIKILDRRVKNFILKYELNSNTFSYERLLDALRRNNYDFEAAFVSLF